MVLNKRKISTLVLATLLMGRFMTNNIEAESVKYQDRTLFITSGEYPGKPGKRSSVANEIILDKDKYDLYDDGTLGEYYINAPFVKKIAEYVQARDNTIKVVEYYRKGPSDDLNAMGDISKNSKGDIYLSIHTNSNTKKSKSGFLAMTSKRDSEFKEASDSLAKSLAERLNDVQNPIKPDRGSGVALNETKIGELNESMKHMPAVLLELGYFSNPDDLQVLTSEKYINTISSRIADVIVEELQSGKYDKDQKDENTVLVYKKKDEDAEELSETKDVENINVNIEEPVNTSINIVNDEPVIEEAQPDDGLNDNDTNNITEDENVEEVQQEQVVSEESTVKESRGLFNLFTKKDVEEVEVIEKSIDEMTIEEVEAEYEKALEELEALSK